MSRSAVLTDAQWELIEPLMPSSDGKRGNRFRDHRTIVEGVVYRFRTGIAWRDLPERFGPWQTVWKRHRRFSGDGTWDRIHTALLSHADAVGEIDWSVSVDSTINRAHQHGTNLTRATPGTEGTGGSVESQESAARAGCPRSRSLPRRAEHEDPPPLRRQRPPAGAAPGPRSSE